MQKLILGTVQMGLDYGINNNDGKISNQNSQLILKRAFELGVKTLDTAEVYGNAHQVIGDFHKKNRDCNFKIITKLPHDIKTDSIETKVLNYLKILFVSSIDVLMFHSFESFKSNNELINLLLKLKSNGYIKNIGVSVYSNHHLEDLLNEDSISVVQLPFNMLDNFSIRGQILNKLKKRGKIIHTRSSFLQGLFFKDLNDDISIVRKLKTELSIVNQISKQLNCSIEELALSYCINQKNIDNVIIGVDNIFHLESNIKSSKFKIGKDNIESINNIKVKNLDLLNPSLWN